VSEFKITDKELKEIQKLNSKKLMQSLKRRYEMGYEHGKKISQDENARLHEALEEIAKDELTSVGMLKIAKRALKGKSIQDNKPVPITKKKFREAFEYMLDTLDFINK